MPRYFKSLFIELVSFLTLFALIGTMSSNFWERYLIQSELSNMKSSLHILKETVHHIGAAYDTLHFELKGLANVKEIKSTNLMPKELKELPSTQDRTSGIFNTFSTMVEHQIMKIKANKSIGNNFPQEHNKSIGVDISKGNDKGIGSAEIIGQNKSTSIDLHITNGAKTSIPESKGTNDCLLPEKGIKSGLKNVTTTTRNPLKSTGVNIDPQLANNTSHNRQNETYNTINIQRCCKDYDCCNYSYKF